MNSIIGFRSSALFDCMFFFLMQVDHLQEDQENLDFGPKQVDWG